jgi:hypothetical protein
VIDPDLSAEDRRTARMLALGRKPPLRTVDVLLEELENTAPERFQELIEIGPTRNLDIAPEAILNGHASVAQLQLLKVMCKRVVLRADFEQLLACTATYFTVLAAALVHHRTMLSDREAPDLKQAWMDLTEATPLAWSEMFWQAGVDLSGES